MSSEPEEESFDIVIIGAGTAGCVLANRLSADSRLSILVIEAGLDRNADPRVRAPSSSASLIGDETYDWCFQTTEQAGLGGRRISHPRGKLLGGSSAINSHCLAYPSQAYHDAWAQYGITGWAWDDIAPYYQKFQSLHLPSDETKTRLNLRYVDKTLGSGPICASYPKMPNKVQAAWIDTFAALGCAVDSDPVHGQATGGLTLTTAIDPSKGERSHAGTAYLAAVSDRPNLKTITDARVERIFFDKGPSGFVATGVRYSQADAVHVARASREVILCAGAFQSPQILELSGIGSAALLGTHGIECLIDNPNVGENLQDHLNIGPSLEVLDGVLASKSLSQDPEALERARQAYAKDQTGPLSLWSVYSFAYTPLSLLATPDEMASLRAELESSPESNTQLRPHYEFTSKTLLNDPSATVFLTPTQRHGDAPTLKEARAASDPGNFITFLAMLSHPYSRGSAHIASPSPHEHPCIDPGYLTHPLDVEILKRHLVGIERLLTQEPLAGLVKPGGKRFPRSFPSPITEMSDADIETMIRRCVATNYHPCGTCTMADTIQQGGVVDAELRVHGTSNLRVCDASILPLVPRGNILSTVYAVAERGADIIQKTLRQGN